MSEPQIWSNVKVDVQTALGAVIAISAISAAFPAVATSVGHPLTNGDYVLLEIKGGREYDIAVVKVGGVTADAFNLIDVDGSALDGFISATAREITFGASADVFTDVTSSGGEPADVAIQTIHTSRAWSKPGNESALLYNLTALWVPSDPVLLEFRRARRAGERRGVRFTFEDGTEVLFSGYPVANLLPGGSAGNPVTTSASVRVRGAVTTVAVD